MKHPNIRLRRIEDLHIPALFNALYVTRAVYKALVQWCILFYILMFTIPKPSVILCQNPPAIPLLAVALLVSLLRRSPRVVIDWHNYGYTWLAVNRPGSTILVHLHYWYERVLGRLAHSHLCVSHAMANDLRLHWGINATVLHDRPQPFFRRSSPSEVHQLMQRQEFGQQTGRIEKGGTAFTYANGGLRPDRPALLVSSTSWTADEDFGVLLDAVVACDKRAKASGASFPQVRFVVTGKGDLLEYYQKKIAALQLSYFTFYTGFYSFADYALILGSADLGVSLHFSSSKLDLPMKVVDMFGSELPVAAYDYGCLSELVQDRVNGFTFTNASQLALILYDVLSRFPRDLTTLERMRDKIKDFKKTPWKSAWLNSALPIFRPDGLPSKPAKKNNLPASNGSESNGASPSSPKTPKKKRKGK